jgi:hypothetical protein
MFRISYIVLRPFLVPRWNVYISALLQSKFETYNPGLLRNADEEFSRTVFSTSTDLFKLLYIEPSAFR